MSFGGSSSNPPWQRNLGSTGQSNMHNQQLNIQNPGLHFQNQLFNQILGIGQQNQDQNSTSFSHSSISNTNNQMQSVTPLFQQQVSSYLNPIAFAGNNSSNNNNSNNGQQSSGNIANANSGGNVNNHQKSQQNQNNSTYNTIGTVTKMHNDCGFVDDEVFFNKNVCKGGIPKVGDRVLVEAAFNTNSPFKWNASRIQIVPSAGPNVQNMQRNQPPPLMGKNIQTSNKGGSGYNAVPPPNEYANQFGRFQNTRRSPIRRSPDRHSIRRDSRQKDDDELDRKRRREDRDRERERHREKRDHSIEKRDRSPVRRPHRPPKRLRQRAAIPRYMVQIPKVSLTMKDADVLDLCRRYNNLYVPSDFFFTQIRWADSFPPNKPFSIQRPCSFHIMHRSVEQPEENVSQNLDAQDADYLFCAKVMLMGTPPITEIYQKCLFDEKDSDEDRDFVHPTRLINFLVGIRGMNETMAIGGPWSPSLDGENPDKDPTVLIKTAIRTCKLLTGIDLSGCTQWYRFVELYYRRAETSHKGRVIPARVETVVIFLPDINSCMPTRIEWDNMLHIYKTNLDHLLNAGNSHGSTFSSSSSLINASSSTGVSSSSCTSSLAAASGKDSTLPMNNNSSTSSGMDLNITSKGAGSGCSTDEPGNEKDETTVVRREPTHYSDLSDLKNMKIQDLRDELLARNLSSKGVKPQLVARLTKAVNAEKLKDNNEKMDDSAEPDTDKTIKKDLDTKISEENDQTVEENVDIDMTDIVVIDECDSTKNDKGKVTPKKEIKIMDEKERQLMERRYQLPDGPNIIVHPSRTAKSGKFDCSLISLSVLLDYRPEDTKEHSFEVSLFAELFNEMLMRDFGFNIYTELMSLPDKPKEKDEKKKDDKKSNDDKKDDHDKDSNEIKIKKENDDKTRDDDDDREKSRERHSSEIDKADKKHPTKERDRDRKLTKPRNHDDDSDDDGYSIKSGDRKKKQKLIVSKPNLLLSFIYFDTTHCGYIFEKDVEDLLYTLGLSLTRAQVRKVLAKVISRNALYYRKLTDASSKSDDNGTIKEAAIQNDYDNIDIDALAKGNKSALPVFKEFSGKNDQNNDQKNIKRQRLSSTGKQTEEMTDSSNSGMVLYNGGLLDIGKLFEQMKRSEKAREETENILTDLRKQNADLQASNTKGNNKIKDLQSDNKSLSRKLGDAEQNISTLTKKKIEYYTTLHSIYDKVSPIIGTNERTTTSSSSSTSKNDSDKEREKDREIHEKDKHELDGYSLIKVY